MRHMSVVIAAGLAACSAVPSKPPTTDNSKEPTARAALPAGSKRLIDVGSDGWSEYYVDYDTIRQHLTGGRLEYTLYSRERPSSSYAWISQAEVIIDCSQQSRLERLIVATNSSGRQITRNDVANGLRTVFKGTRQAAELQAVCQAYAGASSAPAPSSAELISSLTTLTRRPPPAAVPTSPAVATSTSPPPEAVSNSSGLVEGLAAVAAIALLLLGAGYVASKGGSASSLIDDDDSPKKSSSSAQKIVSKQRGSVTELKEEPGGKVIYNSETGTKYKVTGDTITGSDGTSYKVRGTQVISNTGETFERVGSTLLRSSNGRECQLTSSSINCY